MASRCLLLLLICLISYSSQARPEKGICQKIWYKAMGWCNQKGRKLFMGDFNGDGRTDMLCHDINNGYKWVALANSAGQFTGTSWENSMGWCNHEGTELHVGDFNGDGRTDMLCHDSRGRKWIALANSAGQFPGSSWSKDMGWCYHAGAELHVGDFNGDGRTDMLCHDSAGRKWIALANSSGQFPGNSWSKNMGWCYHSGAELHVGDFNGDGRTDMLCHDSTGRKWVALANSVGWFTGTSWEKAVGWCYHAGAELHVGDFNGDGRTDMLCHDSAGNKWIALGNNAGQFPGTPWQKDMGWCYHAGAELHVGDFNGDGRTDMLCHDSSGRKWIALANSAGEFTGNSWKKAMGWCYHAGAELHVGDFNGDGRADMLCHDSTGHKWVALANSAGQFTGTSWEKAMGWCYHTGAKLKVGDFNGDGRDDMLCHDGINMWISLANTDGSFPRKSWQKAITWCNAGNRTSISIGDFNNDRRDDLLCHGDKGANSIMLAQPGGSFNGSIDWSTNKAWCAGEDFHVGDMNGDGRADMVCNERASGKTDILFAGAEVSSLFKGRTTDGRKRQCSGPHRVLFLADFNGDNEQDMLCHDKSSGQKWIDYSCFEQNQGNPTPTPRPQPRPAKGDWHQLNKEPVCFEGKNEKPGIFEPNFEGFLAAVKLVHRSGKIVCDWRMDGSHTSFWGCHNFLHIEDTPLNVFITDGENNILFPKIGATFSEGVHKKGKWYGIQGFDSRSDHLVLQQGFNAPLYLGPKTRLKLWYGEDLLDYTEGDNRGRVCADVYGYFL